MATLESRLGDLITAVGSDVKDITTTLTAARITYTWTVGDSDPTVGGTVTLPTNASWIIQLGLSTSVPSWTPDGSEIQRSSYRGA